MIAHAVNVLCRVVLPAGMPGLQRRLIRYGHGIGLTIPHQLAALLDWNAGDVLDITVLKNGIRIRKRT